MPFVGTHTATMDLSTSQADYAFQLGANFVDYFITIQHHCVQETNDDKRCRSSGSIDFTPRTDVFVTIDGSFNYQLPTNFMTAGAGARVQRPDLPINQQILFGAGGSVTSGLNPPVGSIPLVASGLVPAGHHYFLFYTAQTQYFSGAAVTANSNAVIRFRLTEVPDPAALGPLAIGALLLRRRRQRNAC